MKRTKLAMVRALRGMSQTQLAKRSGVSVSAIRMAEQKVRPTDNLTARTLWLLATALECTMESLMEHESENNFAQNA